MTVLGDQDLRNYLESKKLSIEPIKEKTIRENGCDLTIDNEIGIEIINITNNDFIIDSHNEENVKKRFLIEKAKYERVMEKKIEYFIIQPMSLNLFSTQEYVKFPNDLMGFCALRSSVARHGFIAPITIVDAGFEGTLTIEVVYTGKRPFKLYVGDRFLHLVIEKISSPVKNTYNGVYKGQRKVRIPKCLD